MSLQWFIDSLDARAGLCFASRRAEMSQPNVEFEQPFQGTFIAPPDFSPVSVANQAVALGAARGSFQEGLFFDEREIPFGALEELIEFVRRVYLSSGGGDEGQGPGPPVPPEDQDLGPGGEGGQFPQEGGDLSSLLSHQVKAFYQDLPPLTDRATARYFRWDLPTTDLSRGRKIRGYLQLNPSPLLRGATVLIEEMLCRLPRPCSGDEFVLTWLRAAQVLGQILDTIGLPAEDLFQQIRLRRHHERLDAFYQRVYDHRPIDHRHMYAALFYPWIGPAYYDIPPWDWVSPSYLKDDDLDPAVLLSQVPIPQEVANWALDKGVFEAGSLSLFTLLIVPIAAPRCLAEEPLLADLLIIAVCFLHARHTGPRLRNPIPHGLQVARLEELQLTAAKWLNSALPTFVFPEKLEREIERAPSLRYRADLDSGPRLLLR